MPTLPKKVTKVALKEEEEILPVSFPQTVQLIERYVIQEIELETRKKQLYYHTVDHALAVKRRANQIFHAIYPELEPKPPARTLELINIAALAHDMVQEFVTSDDNNYPRKRQRGVSEHATIIKLTNHIQKLNQKLQEAQYSPSVGIDTTELAIIQEAIAATICHSGLFEHSLYQSDLYHKPDLSLVAKIIALADLGTLGIDGVEAYIQEGILIFLEDNLDIANFLNNSHKQQQFPENLKNRILQANFFMLNFAQERYLRFAQEIDTFSPKIQNIFQEHLFKELNPATINNITNLVPNTQNISLEKLLNFIRQWQHLKDKTVRE